MDTNLSPKLIKQLQRAHQKLSRGEANSVLEELDGLAQRWPNSGDIEHLRALCYKALNQVELSEKAFSASLRLKPNQPEVYNNFGNLVKAQQRVSEAVQHYQQALSLHPTFLQAQRNLAICYQNQNQFELAIDAYSRAIKLSITDVSSITGLADCYRDIEKFDRAHGLYNQVLDIAPRRARTWHNKGVCYHLQDNLSDALRCYEKAYRFDPNRTEIVESFALAKYESGDVMQAIKLFETFLIDHPNQVEVHERFNSMLWETEFSDSFGHSYVTAMNSESNSHELALSYASIMFRANKVSKAESILLGSMVYASDSPSALSLRGQIRAEKGEFELAYRDLEKSFGVEFSADVARQMVKLDLMMERYAQAQTILDQMFSRNSHCQLSWALQSLIWRYTDEPRYRWLCDYDNFVKTYELQTPSQFLNLDDFLESVRLELNEMHRNQRAPLEQTLRNGTQTAARLFHSSKPVIQLLRDSLRQIVERYILELPDDLDHPFLARKRTEFQFSGSWSVCLKPNGFHVNHVHPDGWISSSCYITIPESMYDEIEASTHSSQGHIKFGESPLHLGARERVELTVAPKPGMVVLFPSYFWHGTYQFEGRESDERVTTPFDVTPVEGGTN